MRKELWQVKLRKLVQEWSNLPPTTITTNPNPMSTLPSNEAFLRFMCHLRTLGCQGMSPNLIGVV